MSAANIRLPMAADPSRQWPMPGSVAHKDFSLFAARGDADEVASRLNAKEVGGWSFRVVARPSGFVVEVTDENNHYLGAL